MITEKEKQSYYKAFVEKDKGFEGTFYVGVKTTGVFCHSTCPAKKPKYENCEFYNNSKTAVLSGYRPCKRCNPLSNPAIISPIVKLLIDEIEKNPEKKWTNQDFESLSISAATARRQFTQKFGMTFVEYARSRRLGIALKSIKKGAKTIDAQLDAGFESDSGFRDAFRRTLGSPLSKKKPVETLYSCWIDTKIGSMLAISDEEKLHLLEFVDRRGLEKEIETLRYKWNAVIIPGNAKPLTMIRHELDVYFENPQMTFNTPIAIHGSDFTKSVWNALLEIKTGNSLSYSELAEIVGRPSAIRAVANANGRNQLAIIIPCHRVIGKNGALVGYSGGSERKKWLLRHEGVEI